MRVKFPQMIGYVKNFDGNKTVSFKVDDKKLLKKYNKIWEKIADLLDVQFAGDPVYGDNTKSSNCIALVAIDCVRMNKKYYPQVYLCGCKYQIRKNRMENLINDDFDLSSSESEFEFDYESCNECNDSEV